MAFLQSAPPREPFLHAPASVLWLIGVMVAVHLAIYFGLVPEAVLDYLVFVPARLMDGTDLLGKLVPFVGYIFLHGGAMHLTFNCLWLLAFGPIVARRYGPGLFLGFFLLSGIVSALLYLAFNWGSTIPVIGASGAISGLMGGGLRMMRWPGTPSSGRLAPIFSRQILVFSGFWLITNLIFGLAGFDGQTIAWQAHMGGYLFGLVAISAVDWLRFGRRYSAG
ncbi:MAG: rhomboid family intramembrane serine protease [Rhizomicrobium sp.]|nr:rhomboid family intramembrane serine protease [Rhizomicrobium sp.]